MNIFKNLNEKIDVIFESKKEEIEKIREKYVQVAQNEADLIENVTNKIKKENAEIRDQYKKAIITSAEGMQKLKEKELEEKELEAPYLKKRYELVKTIDRAEVYSNNLIKEFDFVSAYVHPRDYNFTENVYYNSKNDEKNYNFSVKLIVEKNNIIGALVSIENSYADSIEILVATVENPYIEEITVNQNDSNILYKSENKKAFHDFLRGVDIYNLDSEEVEEMYGIIFDNKLNFKENNLYKNLKEELNNFESILNFNPRTIKYKNN